MLRLEYINKLTKGKKMSKLTNTKKEVKQTVPKLFKLAVTMAEISAAYILIQQDIVFMSVIAGVLAVDGAFKLYTEYTK